MMNRAGSGSETPDGGGRGPAEPFQSLTFANVRHEYRSGDHVVPTLGGLSLSVRANEFVTVVGPSGCGKSTLFNLASGLIKPTDGHVKVNGKPLNGSNPYVAYMFQQAALLDWRNVLDNVVIGQEFLGVPRRRARKEAMEGLKRFGLSGFEHRRPWELSGGMRQRVALLRTYLTHRDLLLLDEPFGALDALTRLQMQQFLLDHWEADHRTVVFITHDVDEALLLGDRVLVLADRPTFVLAEATVGFDRPRNAEEILRDPSFVELKAELLAMLVTDGDQPVGRSANGKPPSDTPASPDRPIAPSSRELGEDSP